MNEEWEGNVRVASQIFAFFDAEYARREHDGAELFEGKVGDKILVVSCPQKEPRTLLLEYRTREGVSISGVILQGGELIESLESDNKEERRFLVQGEHGGYVHIAESGFYTTIIY